MLSKLLSMVQYKRIRSTGKKLGISSHKQCCVCQSGRIGTILADPDPDPNPFQPNVKRNNTFFRKILIISKIMMTPGEKYKQGKLALL
jgi:hypothetical protein